MSTPHAFTRFQSRIIGLSELLDGTTLIPLEESPQITEEGWDSLNITYATRRPTLSIEELASIFPLGTKLGSRNWWVVGAKPTCLAAGIWKAEVTFKGWGYSKPKKFTTGAAAEQTTASPGTTPEGSFSTIVANENVPTLRVTYLLPDYHSAPTDEVGKAKYPPAEHDISLPATTWTSISDPTHYYPNGWVLMGSNIDRLPGCTAAMVQDDYKYIHALSP